MTPERLVVDTDIVIDPLKKRPSTVALFMALLESETRFLISPIVVAEVFAGAFPREYKDIEAFSACARTSIWTAKRAARWAFMPTNAARHTKASRWKTSCWPPPRKPIVARSGRAITSITRCRTLSCLAADPIRFFGYSKGPGNHGSNRFNWSLLKLTKPVVTTTFIVTI